MVLDKTWLSGWAQVNYPHGASIKDAEIKLSYDLYYLYNISLWIDFLILIKTIKLVLSAKSNFKKLVIKNRFWPDCTKL